MSEQEIAAWAFGLLGRELSGLSADAIASGSPEMSSSLNRSAEACQSAEQLFTEPVPSKEEKP